MSRRILEAETLLRVLGPPFYVLVDNMTGAEQSEIEAAGTEELNTLVGARDRSDEVRFAARIRLGGLREGRDVVVLAVHARDILGALPDDVVREVLRARWPNKPAYPGFAAVLAEAPTSASTTSMC